ncbi:MAG: RsmF rRNA methyltransferase first C-terminal domain-containing protein, partial [Clostridia bacterium]|nr:RsmF rRNA methyltransferase first C-terminal domain-containing protein [Clostridia bacterium]
DTVAAFLARHPDFRARAFRLPGIDAPDGMYTCWPHRLAAEGQFCALLVRAGDGPAALRRAPLPPAERAAREALVDAVPGAAADARRFGDTLVAAPPLPDLTGLRVLRCGLHLGVMKGRIFQPDHAWCVSAAPPALPRVPLDGEEARRYLVGEAIPSDGPKGWVLPCCLGLPLGLGKTSGGLMKNHYPKGLRRELRGPDDTEDGGV